MKSLSGIRIPNHFAADGLMASLASHDGLTISQGFEAGVNITKAVEAIYDIPYARKFLRAYALRVQFVGNAPQREHLDNMAKMVEREALRPYDLIETIPYKTFNQLPTFEACERQIHRCTQEWVNGYGDELARLHQMIETGRRTIDSQSSYRNYKQQCIWLERTFPP